MIPLSRPLIGAAERAAVDRVLTSGCLAQGPEVAAFEAEFSATAVAGRCCVAVSSGTTALHLGLLAAGIGPGEEVVLPSFSFAASANAIRLAGATPVFVDIDPATFCIDVAAVAAAITPRTTAVMAVHLYGHPCDLDGLVALARRHGLALIEDVAQAPMAALGDRLVGTVGTVAAYSFYPTKNMTTGEGGMVVTGDEILAERVRLLRNQGMRRRYHNEVIGFNARLTEVAAAIGRVQLAALPERNAARRRHAAVLDAQLHGVRTPAVAPGATHAYHQYTVRAANRDALAERLAARGIGCGVYYPVPIHRLPAYGLRLDLPETERAAAEVLSLPVRPDLTAAELAAIVAAVNEEVLAA